MCSKPGRGITPIRFGARVFVRTDDSCRSAVAIEPSGEEDMILCGEMNLYAGYSRQRWRRGDPWCWSWRRCSCCLLWSSIGAASGKQKEDRAEQNDHPCAI